MAGQLFSTLKLKTKTKEKKIRIDRRVLKKIDD